MKKKLSILIISVLILLAAGASIAGLMGYLS